MAYFNFENGKTPINDTNLNAMQIEIMELVFPIGSRYITQTDTNPSTILGFGTWERFNGLIALGLDENDENLKTIGNKVGEKTHTLTEEEIPNHKHNTEDGSMFLVANGNISVNGTKRELPATQSSGHHIVYTDIDDVNINENSATAGCGSGKSHNNMQPSEVVGYMWIRRK